MALPAELDADQRRDLARAFSLEIVRRYGAAVDLAIHAPSKEGDQRNHHAHVFATTRKVSRDPGGALTMGEKTTLELSNTKRKILNDKAENEGLSLKTAAEEVVELRQLWERLTNAALERAGQEARIDSRSLEDQGVDRRPTIHLGPTATEMERRKQAADSEVGPPPKPTGKPKKIDPSRLAAINRGIAAENAEREALKAEIIDLQAERARRERAAQQEAERQTAEQAAREAQARREAEEEQARRAAAQAEREADEAARRKAAKEAQARKEADEEKARRARQEAEALAQAEARREMELEQLAQAAREEAQEEDRAERRRLERLDISSLKMEGWSASQLLTVIRQHLPLLVEEQINGDPALKRRIEEMEAKTQAQSEIKARRETQIAQEAQWRRDHPVRSLLHRVGLFGLLRSAELGALEAARQASDEALNQTARFIEERRQQIGAARDAIQKRSDAAEEDTRSWVDPLKALLRLRSEETPEAWARHSARVEDEADRRRRIDRKEQAGQEGLRAVRDEEARRRESDQLEQDRRRRAREAEEQKARKAEQARLQQEEQKRRALDERRQLETQILPYLDQEVRQAWLKACEAGPRDHQSAKESAWDAVWSRLYDIYRARDLGKAIEEELTERLNDRFDEICVPAAAPSEPEPQQAAKSRPKAQEPEPEDDEEPEPPSWPSSGPSR